MQRNWKDNLKGAHRDVGRVREQVEILVKDSEHSIELQAELLNIERQLSAVSAKIAAEMFHQTRGGR